MIVRMPMQVSTLPEKVDMTYGSGIDTAFLRFEVFDDLHRADFRGTDLTVPAGNVAPMMSDGIVIPGRFAEYV
jgi:hypothetical protein